MMTKPAFSGAGPSYGCGVPRWRTGEAVRWGVTRERRAQVPRRCLNKRSEVIERWAVDWGVETRVDRSPYRIIERLFLFNFSLVP